MPPDVPGLSIGNIRVPGIRTTIFSRSQRFKKWSSENTKIPRPSQTDLPNCPKISAFIKKYLKWSEICQKHFRLIGFTQVLSISGFQRFIKIPPSYFPIFQTIQIEDCFRPIKLSIFVVVPLPPGFPKLSKDRISKMLRYVFKRNFKRDVLFLHLLNISAIIKGRKPKKCFKKIGNFQKWQTNDWNPSPSLN